VEGKNQSSKREDRKDKTDKHHAYRKTAGLLQWLAVEQSLQINEESARKKDRARANQNRGASGLQRRSRRRFRRR
jgi:hypothetical protein